MAIRYCGHVKINCTYRDRQCDYRCALSIRGKQVGTQYVGEPRVLDHAVDSPQAYDSAAHAAIVFAIDDKQIFENDLDITAHGYGIKRRFGQHGYDRVVRHPDQRRSR